TPVPDRRTPRHAEAPPMNAPLIQLEPAAPPQPQRLDPLVEVVGLTKRFGRLEVLRGIDLRLRRGHVTAIVGPNASGKTTLIKTLLGLVRPDGGRIVFDGAEVGRDHVAYRARIGYMAQAARFPENL